jgi:3-hydroxyacyl-CoA dehydrogenase
MSNVTILGAGMMGTAMAWPLSDNGHHVRLAGTHLDTEIIASCLKNRCHPRLRRRLPDNAQIAKALPGLEARGLLGRDELPPMRCLCASSLRTVRQTLTLIAFLRTT